MKINAIIEKMFNLDTEEMTTLGRWTAACALLVLMCTVNGLFVLLGWMSYDTAVTFNFANTAWCLSIGLGWSSLCISTKDAADEIQAMELLREIRDGEVVPEDAAAQFLEGDTKASELHKAREENLRLRQAQKEMQQELAKAHDYIKRIVG